MHILQRNDGFSLDHDSISNNKVGPPRSDCNAIVENRLLHLPTKINSSPFQLNSKAALINHFLKSIPQRIMHLHCATNDFICQFIFYRC